MQSVVISIDRRPDSPGICVGGKTEYDILMKFIFSLVGQVKNSAFTPPAPLKDRLKFVNNFQDSLSIELRFKNNYTHSHGASIRHKDDHKSKDYAIRLYSAMSDRVLFYDTPKIGIYHDLPKYGIDFFLENNFNPAMILYIDYFENYKEIDIPAYCDAISSSVNKVTGA